MSQYSPSRSETPISQEQATDAVPIMNSAATTIVDRQAIALSYARRGWLVFPIAPGQKTPLTKHGHRDATTSETIITAWWTRWPNANIGLATGRESGVVVLDVDPRNAGDESLLELQKEHGSLPKTAMASTGGGGTHYVFAYPNDTEVRCSAGVAGLGLDVKADGGYVVAPPSLHPNGQTYKWADAHDPDAIPLAKIPTWLLTRMRPAPTAVAGVPFVVPEKILESRRNDMLFKAARSMKTKGWSKEAIGAAIRAENSAKCSPPLQTDEIEKLINHAWTQADRPEFAQERVVDPIGAVEKEDELSLTTRLRGMRDEDVRSGWRALVASAELPADGLERVLKSIVKATGVALGTLRKSFNNYLKEARAVEQVTAPDPSVVLVDTLLAEEFNNGTTLINTEARQFWSYNSRYWEKIDDGVLRGLIQRVAEKRWDWVAELFAAQGKQAPPTMARLVAETLSVLGSRTIQPGDPLRLMSSRPSVINVQNGSLWLEDSKPELRPHNPEDYLTFCSPLEYDPQATAPTFEQLLRSMLCYEDSTPLEDQDEMYRHVLELLGYVCQAGRFLKVFFILYGPGDNGKTQFAKLLELIVGRDAIAFDRLSGVDEEGSRFAAARLIGKLAVIDDDATNDYQLPDGLLKKIAEEKLLTAEEKFKGAVTFICQVVVIILTNSLPITTDTSRGMRTRAQVLHFPRQFKRADEVGPDDPNVQRPDLWRQVFELELPGVLNLLIAGFYRVKKRGSFSPPPSAVKAFDLWLSNTNAVPRFIAEACEPIGANKFEHTTSMFYDGMTMWCRTENVAERFRPSQHTLKKRLVDLGYRVKHTNAGTAVFGLRLKARWKPSMIPTWDDPEAVKAAINAADCAELI